MIIDHKHRCDCPEGWVSICARTHGDERRFSKVAAENGKIELVAWLNGSTEARFDVTPDEAYALAEALVEQAEKATVQAQERAAAKAQPTEADKRRQEIVERRRLRSELKKQ